VKRGERGRQAQAPYGAFKAQVALATLKADRTVNELAGPAQRPSDADPTRGKKQLLAGAETVFANGVRVEGWQCEAQKAEFSSRSSAQDGAGVAEKKSRHSADGSAC